MQKLGLLVGTAGGLSAAWWVYSRLSARAELEAKLEESPEVFAARIYARTTQLGPEYAWLTTGDGVRQVAADLIRLTNNVTVPDAYAQVLASLPRVPAAQVSAVLPGLISGGLDAISEALGVKVPRSVQSEAQKLTQTSQGTQLENVLSATQGLWGQYVGVK